MDAEVAVGSLLAVGSRLATLVQQAADMPRDKALRLLARQLDEIALAYHDIPDSSAHDREAEAVKKKFDFAPIVAAAFPELGQYWCAHPSEEKLTVGDAKDDLSDILCDLAAVRWRSDNLTPTAAAFYARLMQGHTLSHLFELRRVVHYQLSGW